MFSSSFWVSEFVGMGIVALWSLTFAAFWAFLETLFPYLKGGFGR